jgi:hypothetical protein
MCVHRAPTMAPASEIKTNGTALADIADRR